MLKVGVIGGGASGLSAAIAAAEAGAQVTVIEKKEQAGKKILVTGNGRCNLTNAVMEPSCYHASDRAFVERFLERFSTEDALSMFRDLDLLCTDRDGYFYPRSLQASSVLSVLTEKLKRLNVSFLYNTDAENVKILKNGFQVICGGKNYTFDRLILACGSESGVRDKKAFIGYELARSLGHHINTPLPALVKLTGHNGFEDKWAGVRTTAAVIYGEYREEGELQLNADGISGIPVFQLSGHVVRQLKKDKKVSVCINFMPEYGREELTNLLKKVKSDEKPEDFLKGWLPKKLIPVVLAGSGIRFKTPVRDFTDEDRERLIGSIQAFSYTVTGHGGFEDSQVTSGGVPLSEITDEFESGYVPGLYFTGELLDVDGRCGGYNLHFAWGSGKLAGTAAGRIK